MRYNVFYSFLKEALHQPHEQKKLLSVCWSFCYLVNLIQDYKRGRETGGFHSIDKSFDVDEFTDFFFLTKLSFKLLKKIISTKLYYQNGCEFLKTKKIVEIKQIKFKFLEN